jgi:AraC-like DNA-binding protein
MRDLNYNECKQRGTSDFPIEYYYIDKMHPRYEMPFHWHIEYEILFIRQGRFLISLDGEKYLLKEHDVCFITDGVLHGGTPDDCIYDCIVFNMELLRHRNYQDDIFLRKIVHHQLYIVPVIHSEQIQNHETVIPLFMSLFPMLKNKKNGYQLYASGVLRYFFSLIESDGLYKTDAFTGAYGYQRSRQLKAALDLIETSYQNALSLEELSKAAGLSPKYFCLFFRKLTGRTPIDYLNFFRIGKACFQIAEGDDSLLDISLNCGFTDYSYFIRVFKKYKGISPRKYMLAYVKDSR